MRVQTEVGAPIVVTDASFDENVLASPVLTIVDFWAPWCPPCRAISASLSELAAEYAGRMRVAKLNTDEHQRWMSKFGIMAIPTMIVFKGGREVKRIQGAVPKRILQEAFEAALAG